jgi:dihydrofolate reductase
MILSQIAAMASNRVIGVNNGLPWDIPEDMKFFREKTKGHIMIMGRKTFESFGKPLPKRFHIVISRQPQKTDHPEVIWVSNFEQAVQIAQRLIPKWPEEVFIVGGGQIYEQTLPKTDRIYLTVIEKPFEGDAKFPEFSELEFELKEKKDRTEPIPFSFRLYERRR